MPAYHEQKTHITINISYGEGMWTGVCDEIALVTEARSIKQLKRRVHDIAPELFHLNQQSREEKIVISFLRC